MESDLVHNERMKLTAGFVDRLSTASIVIGVLVPVVNYLGNQDFAGIDWPKVVSIFAFFVFVGAGLHVAARELLRKLRG